MTPRTGPSNRRQSAAWLDAPDLADEPLRALLRAAAAPVDRAAPVAGEDDAVAAYLSAQLSRPSGTVGGPGEAVTSAGGRAGAVRSRLTRRGLPGLAIGAGALVATGGIALAAATGALAPSPRPTPPGTTPVVAPSSSDPGSSPAPGPVTTGAPTATVPAPGDDPGTTAGTTAGGSAAATSAGASSSQSSPPSSASGGGQGSQQRATPSGLPPQARPTSPPAGPPATVPGRGAGTANRPTSPGHGG